MKRISQLPAPQDNGLLFEGSPRELADAVELCDRAEDFTLSPHTVTFGGLNITKVNRSAQHDGHPAFGFTLTDKCGQREVGRLVLLDTEQQLDETPEWTGWLYAPEGAAAYLKRLTIREALPEVCSGYVDMAFGTNGETLEEAIAQISSKHGVSIKVLNLRGPGGGWPEVEVIGYAYNVRKALMDPEFGWGLSEDDADDAMGPVSVSS